MNATRLAIRYEVPRAALSLALLTSSAFWLLTCLGAWATRGPSRDGSAAPLFGMLILMVTPPICFAIGLILVGARKRARLSRLDWCALLAGSFPITLGTLLAVWMAKVLLTMSGGA